MPTIKDFKKIIKTARLEMRPLEATSENATIIFNVLKNESPEDFKYEFTAYPNPLPSSAEEMLAVMKSSDKRHGDNGINFYIFYNDNFIGYCRVVVEGKIFMLADIWFIKSARGRFFIKEALDALEKIAFEELGVEKAWWGCNSENITPVKLSKIIGCRLEEIIKETDAEGKTFDKMIFTRHKSEYFSQTNQKGLSFPRRRE